MKYDETSMIYVADSRHGKGVFAARDIRKGEQIYQFTGNQQNFEQSKNSGEDECYSLQIGEDLYINPDAPGRYINHTCDPNCGIKDMRLIALKNIKAGEELSFDYSTTMLERHWVMQCGCGLPACRGVVEDFDKLALPVQNRYIKLGIVQPFILQILKH